WKPLGDVGPGVAESLLQAEREAALRLADGQDYSIDVVTLLEDVGRLVDAFGPGHLGHVDEALDAGLDPNEGAEVGEPSDGSGDTLADGVALSGRVPGLRLKLLEAERDSLALRIELENFDFDLLTGGENFFRACDARPGDVADV